MRPHHQLLPQPSKSSPPAVEDPAGSHRPPVAGSVGLLGPRKKGTKATTSVRAWLLIDSEGNSQVLEAGKHAIMRRTGLPARDLRILDPVLRCPSTVLGRERAIVINLEHIKAIITAQEVLLVNSADLSVTPFVDELRRRLVRHQQATTIASEGNDDGHTKLHDLGESRQNSPSGQHDGVGKEVVKKQLYGSKVLSFEFVALETCLEAACTSLENEAKGLEKEAHPALEKLSSKISTLNLERVRQIKSRLVAISGRVQKVRDEIEHLLDDDEDMAEMYLTDKLSVESDLENSSASSMNEQMRDEMDDEIHQAAEVDDRNSDTGTGTSKQLDVEELEMLLEAYFVQIDGTLNKLSTLREDVDDTEDYINIMLDDKQNQLLQMGVVLSTATLVVNAFIVVAGIFGMNIGIELFDEELKTGNKKFMWTIGGSSMACVFFFVIAIAWGKHMRLLDIPSLFFVCSRRIRKNVRWFA
ncbi:hypothetical protein RchiOBHm_Chr5g0031661 [Rosa chinensis]|uniref:Magnesium transporter n=1 Tax=Rosa chinensis TaxID=74649 RepID=A0A2P6QA91_ROSCH|nr:magnesium transporter MRS2-3 [Rosa chinensis]PRQ31090.1 hypothetical protein RchiOBHm_Chr5g0031661 [Rosa chinensis]